MDASLYTVGTSYTVQGTHLPESPQELELYPDDIVVIEAADPYELAEFGKSGYLKVRENLMVETFLYETYLLTGDRVSIDH